MAQTPGAGLACQECRRKRVRCDRERPQCMACTAAGVECVFRESGPPRGPKKGYLKSLQDKIEVLQSQLEKQQPQTQQQEQPRRQQQSRPHGLSESHAALFQQVSPLLCSSVSPSLEADDILAQWQALPETPYQHLNGVECAHDPFSRSLFSSFPSQDDLFKLDQSPSELDIVISPIMHNDLDQLYFDRAHAIAPIVQTHRYQSWSKAPNKSSERLCLQYAMWTLASSLSHQFQLDGRKLYAKTKSLLYEHERSHSCAHSTIEQAQAWTLLALYELTCQDFHRGMMSAGRAFRVIQMMRLYEIGTPKMPRRIQLDPDCENGNLSFHRPGQDDWVDIEIKRRTFWLAFMIDRFTSMIDGLHMFFREEMIRTRLPAPEHNFQSNLPIQMGFLADEIPSADQEWWPQSSLSPFAECVIAAAMCGRVLKHTQTSPDQLDPEFCRRHHGLSTVLSKRIETLRIRAAYASPDPIAAFVALAANISVLTLYDLVEPRFMEIDAQGRHFDQSLHFEQEQQALVAVDDLNLLLPLLGQHFYTYPFTPIMLLHAARFSQAYPSLNNANTRLLSDILAMLRSSARLSGLTRSMLQHFEPTQQNWR